MIQHNILRTAIIMEINSCFGIKPATQYNFTRTAAAVKFSYELICYEFHHNH